MSYNWAIGTTLQMHGIIDAYKKLQIN